MKILKHIPLTSFKGGAALAIAFLLGMGIQQITPVGLTI